MEIMHGLEGLRNLRPLLDDRFRYAVEVRHQSWFQDLAYNFFADNNFCMVWSQLARIRTPPIVTSDFLYVRFIGDRSIDEKDFGKIQKDRVFEMNKWARGIKEVESGNGRGKNKEVGLAMIAANNHYAGFGLGLLICSEKWLVYQNYHGKINNKYKNNCNYDSNNKRRNKISMLAIQE